MTDRKSPLQQALDLFVYAPLGLLMNAEEIVPQLVEKGRQQVTMARMFGQMAVQQGSAEAGKAVGKLQEQAVEVVTQLSGARHPREVELPTAPATTAPAKAAATASDGASHATKVAPAPAHATAASTLDAPAVESLAIPDYDSLSASQVVPRLEGLAIGELDAVRQYEIAHRGRKTILSKISQLQG